LPRVAKPIVQPVITQEDLLRASSRADQIYVDNKIKNYIVELIMASRKPGEYGLSRIANLVNVGGSPRATISLYRAAKAQPTTP